MSKPFSKAAMLTGYFISATGLLHLVAGFVLYGAAAKEMWNAGLMNTASQQLQWFGFFWFQINGLFVLFIGALVQHYIRSRQAQLPRRFGYYLLAIALIGCLFEPFSGFYVYLLIAGLILFPRKYAGRPAKQELL